MVININTYDSSRGQVVDFLGNVGGVLGLPVEVGPQLQQPAQLPRLDQLLAHHLLVPPPQLRLHSPWPRRVCPQTSCLADKPVIIRSATPDISSRNPGDYLDLWGGAAEQRLVELDPPAEQVFPQGDVGATWGISQNTR